MKIPLLLALLLGTVSTLHLGDEAVPQDGEMPENEAKEAPTGELMLLKEGEEEYSGSEDAPEEEGSVEPAPALDAEDEEFQCPKEEDTVKLEDSPGCKNCPRFLLVKRVRRFYSAQYVCRRCYRGNLISIHNIYFNRRLQYSVSRLNQGQVWIGGRVVGCGRWKRFCWIDGSRWDFGYWAAGQPRARGGRCVALCTRGGHWRRTHCRRTLPFICSF